MKHHQHAVNHASQEPSSRRANTPVGTEVALLAGFCCARSFSSSISSLAMLRRAWVRTQRRPEVVVGLLLTSVDFAHDGSCCCSRRRPQTLQAVVMVRNMGVWEGVRGAASIGRCQCSCFCAVTYKKHCQLLVDLLQYVTQNDHHAKKQKHDTMYITCVHHHWPVVRSTRVAVCIQRDCTHTTSRTAENTSCTIREPLVAKSSPRSTCG